MRMKRLSSLLVLGAIGMSVGCAEQPTAVDNTKRHEGSRAIAQQAMAEQVDPDQMVGALEEPAEEDEEITATASAPVMMATDRQIMQRRRFRGVGRWRNGGWWQSRWYGRRFWQNTWWDPYFTGTRVVYVRVPTVVVI
ncbi:hypothetical protein J7643_00470 [bacterium]|nr:hypothetical protein [bacterium]